MVSTAARSLAGLVLAGVSLLGWHGLRSATRARVMVYNDGPAALAEVRVRWQGAAASWSDFEPEGSRQAWLGKGFGDGGSGDDRLWLSWVGGDLRPRVERLELTRGEMLVVRLRSDEEAPVVTRTRAWARDLADWVETVAE